LSDVRRRWLEIKYPSATNRSRCLTPELETARSVIPEFQNLVAGDVVPMSPDGNQGMNVHSMKRLTR
jgi:hypothetical protein